MAEHNKNKLSLIYDNRQKDFVVKFPRKCDGGLLMSYILSEIPRYSIDKELKREFPYREWYSFKEDLEKRGYDLETLKFSVELKEPIH